MPDEGSGRISGLSVFSTCYPIVYKHPGIIWKILQPVGALTAYLGYPFLIAEGILAKGPAAGHKTTAFIDSQVHVFPFEPLWDRTAAYSPWCLPALLQLWYCWAGGFGPPQEQQHGVSCLPGDPRSPGGTYRMLSHRYSWQPKGCVVWKNMDLNSLE